MSDEVAQGREPAGAPGPFAPGGRHRRTLVMAAVVLAFLVVIAVIGIFRDPATPKPRTTPTPTPTAATTTATASGDAYAEPPLQLTSVRCAKLDGRTLTLGYGVVNRGPAALGVSRLSPAFPIGGLAVDDAGTPDASTCPTPPRGLPAVVEAGGEAVLAVVLKADDPRCIGPLVVDVEISYNVDNAGTYGQNLHVFPDLGGLGLPSECGSSTP